MYESKIPKSTDNSKEALIEWSRRALDEAVERRTITVQQSNVLYSNALHEIRIGGFRGNISDSWGRWGFTQLDIPDMYV